MTNAQVKYTSTRIQRIGIERAIGCCGCGGSMRKASVLCRIRHLGQVRRASARPRRIQFLGERLHRNTLTHGHSPTPLAPPANISIALVAGSKLPQLNGRPWPLFVNSACACSSFVVIRDITQRGCATPPLKPTRIFARNSFLSASQTRFFVFRLFANPIRRLAATAHLLLAPRLADQRHVAAKRIVCWPITSVLPSEYCSTLRSFSAGLCYPDCTAPSEPNPCRRFPCSALSRCQHSC